MQNTLHKFPITWEQVHRDAKQLAKKLQSLENIQAILAVSKGGLVPSAIIAKELNITLIDTICLEQNNNIDKIIKSPQFTDNVLIIDDIVKAGNTIKAIKELLPQAYYASLYVKDKGESCVNAYITKVSQDTWIQFPWEN